ncbi:hypothetical protein MSUIS_05130 [Mycoplasma suis KI3806]|uniref:Uncharacterized protein n=1 Tax=Mycoplasma suis (strain KI_3806) TaxID=708248 RepID=F0V1S5_MYCS3|nr:hypothetical protein [Mycoplasma suis]CBZ40606.1 hypothetical protein MSUIS_05130 [Mycoplasma suis KI3806]
MATFSFGSLVGGGYFVKEFLNWPSSFESESPEDLLLEQVSFEKENDSFNLKKTCFRVIKEEENVDWQCRNWSKKYTNSENKEKEILFGIKERVESRLTIEKFGATTDNSNQQNNKWKTNKGWNCQKEEKGQNKIQVTCTKD